VDIERNVQAYLRPRVPMSRYTSFDYCFNYFQSHYKQGRLPELLRGDALQVSCLHLGFYLASWGMLRGSTDLLRRSVRHFVPVIEVIANAAAEVWQTDAHTYGDGSCPAVFGAASQIQAALPGASDILVTKIMLGTFGCVPAFDTYFKQGFRVWTFGPKALRRVGDFYNANAKVIERNRVHTLGFKTGKPTKLRYSRAKVIDMIFFVAGLPRTSLRGKERAR